MNTLTEEIARAATFRNLLAALELEARYQIWRETHRPVHPTPKMRLHRMYFIRQLKRGLA